MNSLQLDLSWLAGLFEGEGTTGLFKALRTDSPHWKIRSYFLICNNDPIIINEVHKIAAQLGVNMHIVQRERPVDKDWGLNYQIVCKNLKDIHTMISAILPYVRGNKRAIIEMTIRFIESREFGKAPRGPGRHYSDEEMKLADEVQIINKRGKDKVYKSSETLRKALTEIERITSGDDKAQTSMKVGDLN